MSKIAADIINIDESVVIDMADKKADFVHMRHDENARPVGTAGERAQKIADTVGVKIGEQLTPLATKDLADLALESAHAVRIGQFLEQALGIVERLLSEALSRPGERQ